MRSYSHRYAHSLSQLLGVLTTLVLAIVFEMLVVSGWTVYFWPQWLLLIICYWAIKAPNLLPLGIVLLLGLVLDVIHANLLGVHAIVLLVLVYVLQKFHQRLQLFPVLQQAFWVMMITAVYQAALLGFQYWLYPESVKVSFDPWRELTILSSFVMWPLLQFLLNSLDHKRERH